MHLARLITPEGEAVLVRVERAAEYLKRGYTEAEAKLKKQKPGPPQEPAADATAPEAKP